MLLAASGGAVATSPAPKFEYRVDVPDEDRTVMTQRIDFKAPIGERCLPREVLCVGPYAAEYHNGDHAGHGARVHTNDTWVLAGHNTSRHQQYGPYVVPTNENDFPICSTPCKLPDPFYVALHANVTVELHNQGEIRPFSFEVNRSLNTLYPGVIPRTWCTYAQQTRC